MLGSIFKMKSRYAWMIFVDKATPNISAVDAFLAFFQKLKINEMYKKVLHTAQSILNPSASLYAAQKLCSPFFTR